MNKILNSILCTFLLIVFTGQLRADFVVNPIGATSSLADNFGTNLVNTINGTGLSSFPSLTATHVGTTPADSWVGLGTKGTIDFDLGDSFVIDGFSFWNQNGGGPGANGNTGIQQVNVLSSTDGVTFTEIVGAPTMFAQIFGTGPELPETFSFAAVEATHIRFDVGGSHGDQSVGFAEVAFHGIDGVPEPSAVLVCSICAAVFTAARRRRR